MRLCEVYESLQGEGPNTGEPTTFVRFGGCNLRCPGWGEGELPDGTIVPGCDTVFAVYPEWGSTWDKNTPAEVAALVNDFPQRVCITGGEPLIQAPKRMQEFVSLLRLSGHTIDLFTNGSKELPVWAKMPYTTVIMDYKLPGSGEYGSFDDDNWQGLNSKDAIKFVCKDDLDFGTAMNVIEEHLAPYYGGPQVYFGVVWGVDPSWLAGRLAEYPKLKAMMNLQTHKYVFGDIRGV